MQNKIPALLLTCLAALCSSICCLAMGVAVSLAAGVQPPAGRLVIDSLADRFTPVSFDHELHDSYANCIECHHHTTGEPPSDQACLPCHRSTTTADVVGCRGCHPTNRFSHAYLEEQDATTRYHIDIPGLLGAYHLNCISCHEGIGTGPTDCQGCHDAKD